VDRYYHNNACIVAVASTLFLFSVSRSADQPAFIILGRICRQEARLDGANNKLQKYQKLHICWPTGPEARIT
jgi:hypothetical protein